MDGSQLSAFLIWNVHNSVPSSNGTLRARFPYIEYSDLRAFFVWECVHVNLSTCTFLIWNVQISVHVPSLYGMFRSQYMYLPYMGCSDLGTCTFLIWDAQCSVLSVYHSLTKGHPLV